MQAVLANIMHQSLREKIGEEVSCLSWENGELVEYRGVLKQVLPFNGIMIDDDFIKFESREQTIHQVFHLPENKSLYLNPDTLGYGQDDLNEEKGKGYR